MGWWRATAVPILAQIAIHLIAAQAMSEDNRVDDPDIVNDLAVLHVFGKHLLKAGFSRAMYDQRIPVRGIAKPMEIDR
ncbi:MAG: hypothetical protein ABSF23_00680 [Terracidiphilus sp.]|jgi:hypothetical protein